MAEMLVAFGIGELQRRRDCAVSADFDVCEKKPWFSCTCPFYILLPPGLIAPSYIKQEFTRIREIKVRLSPLWHGPHVYRDLQFYAAAPFAISVIFSDVLISVALCKFLNNSRTGYSDTNTLITRLMVFSINRCVLLW